MVQLAKLVLFGTLWPATMRERHLMLVAWMNHPPSLAPLASQGLHNSSPMTGHNKETTPHGLALQAPSLAHLASKGTHHSPPKAGHHWEKTPHASSLGEQASLALLTWLFETSMAGHHIGGMSKYFAIKDQYLDQAWFNTSWPAITRERHLMLLALMSQPLALLTWPSRATKAGHLMEARSAYLAI
ncbi:hypothetical protein TIFTF001_052005 [Ficus carica]|uniref:Uncharacterized protein n=1 Tax=Ficus carica TaxID=3494 RepID=A0AA88JD70_FICCA|nr:hypothetical protein TIFTF001_052005 [Ficus carica]